MTPEPLAGMMMMLRDVTDRLLRRAARLIVDEKYAPVIGRVKSAADEGDLADWRGGEAVRISGLDSGLHGSDLPVIYGEIKLGPWPGAILRTEEVPFDVDGRRVSLTLEGDDRGRWRVQQPDQSVDSEPTLHRNMTYYLRYLVEDSPEQLVREISAQLPALPDVPSERLDLSRLLRDASAAPGGVRLVVGGGHLYRSPKPGEVFVNIEPDTFPDLLSDVADLRAIPDASVDEVFLERVSPQDALAQEDGRASAEIARVLKPGGVLVARGGFPAYHAAWEAVEANLTEAGMQNVKLNHPWTARNAALVTAEKPVDGS